jgi:thymidylate synthase (FAD)
MVVVVMPSFDVELIDGGKILVSIEAAGRTCYKSKSDLTIDTAKKFVAMIIGRKHESVLEHEKITVRIVCDRGVTHEIVRHRLNAFSQESTRFCNYGNENHGGQIRVVMPPTLNPTQQLEWQRAVEADEALYLKWTSEGVHAQIARSILPTCLQSEIVWTCNIRQWRHVFRLRTAKAAHPQMREIMIPMLAKFKELVPIVFDDIIVEA